MAARVIAGLAMALWSASPSWADPNIAGLWDFEAGPYHSQSCRLIGTLHLTPRGEGRFDCAMQVKESCADGRVIDTEQTCEAEQDDTALVIISTLLSVNPPDAVYFPDDFDLTIMSATRMEGELAFADVIAPATFFRRLGIVS